MKTSGLNVLCIDDDDLHVAMLRKAASRDSRPLDIRSVTKGEDALLYLKERRNRPDIILLDYNMPGRDGLSILKEIRADIRLKAIPVLMVSGISEAKLVRDAYEHGANIYFVKPCTLERYTEFVALFITLWAVLAELPCEDALDRTNVVR